MHLAFFYQAIVWRTGDQNSTTKSDRYDLPLGDRFAHGLIVHARFLSGLFDRIRPSPSPFRFLAH